MLSRGYPVAEGKGDRAMIKVFIETEAGSREKNRYDNLTLRLNESFEVPLPYPYAYGFALGTKSGDGGGIDCFVLGAEGVKTGTVIECEVIGLLEMLEGDEVDHKLITRFAYGSGSASGGGLDPAVVETIKAFILVLFKKFPEVKIEFGELLGREAAREFLGPETD
jgi:inorganic pyrophosphatase